ncbi:MAG TPA: thioesterase domain-containing protein, partial [Novosphingobium sp.]|nr:thioesterase domain-containing protein [Novosphingobium sp.]
PADPPATDTERWLATLWHDILGTLPTSKTDNFFLLGANSLHATKLVGKIRARLEADVPFTLPFRGPTLVAMASALDETISVLPDILLKLRDGDGPALFLFHPAGGHVRAYGPLVDALSNAGPVYGLQSPQLNAPEQDVGGVAGLAKLHLQHIRQAQPHGPYRLMGWSFGGWLAAEVAALLEAEGAEVEWLSIVDARADVRRGALNLPDLPLSMPFIACLESRWQQNLLGRGRDRCHMLEQALAEKPHEQQMAYALDWFRAEVDGGAERPRDLQLLQLQLFTACHRMMRDHALKPIRAPIHIWWAEDTLADKPYRPGAEPGEWSAYGASQIRILEGDHQSIIRNPVLAADLDELLSRGRGA